MVVHFELEGNSPDTINSVAALCMLGLLLAIALGCLLDRGLEQVVEKCESCSASKRPPGYAILLLIASYVLLLPGLYSVLFSFNIMLDFGLIKLGLGPGGTIDKAPAITESMMGLLGLLEKTGASTASHAILTYALIIPTIKLVLLVLGQALRVWPCVANFCTRAVQVISKWACPDMFAYILLLHLVRGMNHPRMLCSEMQLDLGFTCFSLFCIGSTLASLGIHAGDDEGSSSCSWKVPCKWLAGEAMMLVVLLLFLGFIWNFQRGLSHPIMALRIHIEVLFQPTGPIPDTIMGISTRPVIEQLKIPEKANADVSLLSAMMSLKEDGISTGEVNSIIGLVMIAFFVVALTIADMVLLLVISLLSRCGQPTRKLVWLAVALKKMSMLDVLIMGVVVVTMCMAMYQKDGIFVTAHSGLYSLICAEVIHYVTFFLVTCAPERLHDGAAYSGLSDGNLVEVTPPLAFSDTEARGCSPNRQGGSREKDLDLLPKHFSREGDGL